MPSRYYVNFFSFSEGGGERGLTKAHWVSGGRVKPGTMFIILHKVVLNFKFVDETLL